jgi:hypothetical protein
MKPFVMQQFWTAAHASTMGQKGYIISKFPIQHKQYQQFYFDHSYQKCRGYWQSLAESLDMEQLALNKDLVLSL